LQAIRLLAGRSDTASDRWDSQSRDRDRLVGGVVVRQMSAVALTLGEPIRALPTSRRALEASLSDTLVVEFATAVNVRSGLTRVAEVLQRSVGAKRVEWWGPTDDGGGLQLEIACGSGDGERIALPLGAAGALIVVTCGSASEICLAVTRLVPLLRRQWTAQQLTREASLLARRNEALEDFAALVAHELKTPLHLALLDSNCSGNVERALDLVDGLLETARAESAAAGSASASECLGEAMRDLGTMPVDVVATLTQTLPLPAAALRLIFRNLLANAVAAGARQIHVSAVASDARSILVVDDDGFGLGPTGGYAAGSGLGFMLCRRVAARFGGVLELKPRVQGGTRATLVLDGA
jgi:signal transduction histidine kinase